MSLGKRKADQLEDAPVSKKAAKTLSRVTVAYHEGGEVKPIIATTSGIPLPSNLRFASFTNKETNGGSALLLHSSTHPTIDFTAIGNDNHNDKHLKHYVAVFDPTTGQLLVTGARRLTARSSVRRPEVVVSDDEASGEEPKAITNYSSRATLTNTFGTKKSKKAVQSIAENRLLARGGEDANSPLSKAILSSMPESDVLEDTNARQLARSNKPLPVPDLNTEDVNLAYPFTSLIFPGPSSTTLAQMPITAWADTVAKGKAVNVTSRFVANRVFYLVRAFLASPEDAALKTNLQLLRYMLLLIELSRHISLMRPNSRIPTPSSWSSKPVTGNISFPLITGILNHFFPSNQLARHGITLLHTTILALALHIPPPSLQVMPGTLITEPTDLQMDLALEPALCSKYYKELGCKMVSATDPELSFWGMEKLPDRRETEEGQKNMKKPRFAKLTLPLVFPTMGTGRKLGRRR